MTDGCNEDREREIRLNIVFLEEAKRKFRQVAETMEMQLLNKELHIEVRHSKDVSKCIKSLEDSLNAMSTELTQKLISANKASGNQ
jgi:hypothetical protein